MNQFGMPIHNGTVEGAEQQGQGDQLYGIQVPDSQELYPEPLLLHGGLAFTENCAYIRVTNQLI